MAIQICWNKIHLRLDLLQNSLFGVVEVYQHTTLFSKAQAKFFVFPFHQRVIPVIKMIKELHAAGFKDLRLNSSVLGFCIGFLHGGQVTATKIVTAQQQADIFTNPLDEFTF